MPRVERVQRCSCNLKPRVLFITDVSFATCSRIRRKWGRRRRCSRTPTRYKFAENRAKCFEILLSFWQINIFVTVVKENVKNRIISRLRFRCGCFFNFQYLYIYGGSVTDRFMTAKLFKFLFCTFSFTFFW